MAAIYITEEDNTRHKFRLPNDPALLVTIGRGEHCLISLPNVVGLSGYHCAIILRDGRYILRDEGSTNGTFEGKRAISAEEMRPGVAYKIGTAVMVFDPEHTEAAPIQTDKEKPASPTTAAQRVRNKPTSLRQMLLLLFLMVLAFGAGMILRCYLETGAFPPCIAPKAP